jgi:hypothetical protein
VWVAGAGWLSTHLRQTHEGMRRAARRDANHQEIVREFRRLGYSVLDLATVGGGIPDALIWKGKNQAALVEIKTEKGRLKANQKAFSETWPGPVFTCRSIEEVLDIDRAIRCE